MMCACQPAILWARSFCSLPLHPEPMKTSFCLFLGLLFCAASASSLRAADSDLEMHSVPLKIDSSTTKSSTDGGANRTKEHWVYQLTIENKSFHDVTGLQVKYVILYTHEQLGDTVGALPKRKLGSFPIPVLKSREKLTFKTDAVELNKANLVGNYIYPSGAKPNAQDTLAGVALHVELNGQVFAQFANPSSLSKEPVQ